jgi:hypothetical protein
VLTSHVVHQNLRPPMYRRHPLLSGFAAPKNSTRVVGLMIIPQRGYLVTLRLHGPPKHVPMALTSASMQALRVFPFEAQPCANGWLDCGLVQAISVPS